MAYGNGEVPKTIFFDYPKYYFRKKYVSKGYFFYCYFIV